MPLIVTKTFGTIKLALWEILEFETELINMINPDQEDLSVLKSFGNESRRKQWLACRILLGSLMETDHVRVVYDEHGKPALKGFSVWISVSHTPGMAAVIVNTKESVGLDIEQLKPRIERVTSKFLNPVEMEFLNRVIPSLKGNVNRERKSLSVLTECELERLYIYWCAKEAVYKLHGRKDLDLKNGIIIQPFDYFCNPEGNLTARLVIPEGTHSHQLLYEKFPGHMLVYTLS